MDVSVDTSGTRSSEKIFPAGGRGASFSPQLYAVLLVFFLFFVALY